MASYQDFETVLKEVYGDEARVVSEPGISHCNITSENSDRALFLRVLSGSEGALVVFATLRNNRYRTVLATLQDTVAGEGGNLYEVAERLRRNLPLLTR